MRPAIAVCVLAAIVWIARSWSMAIGGKPPSAGALLVGGLCIGLAAWGWSVWLRKRRRRRMLDTRDSALW